MNLLGLTSGVGRGPWHLAVWMLTPRWAASGTQAPGGEVVTLAWQRGHVGGEIPSPLEHEALG